MSQILIFGDSIAHGTWDKKGGWVSRLRNFLHEKDSDYNIYNLSVSADNTEDLLKRFEFETKQRLKEDEETIFIFAIGINDSQYLHEEDGLRVPLDEFKSNIRKLIEIAQKFSSKIIFVGLTSVDETKTTPIPWNTNKSYKNEYVQKYNGFLESVCKEKNLIFLNLFDKLNKSELDDGLHPNSKGHKKIFEIVKEASFLGKI